MELDSGQPQAARFFVLRLIKMHKYHNLNLITIKKENLEFNYFSLQKKLKHALMAPVLKSNAYGHGLKEVGKIADQMNFPFLIVDSLHEAYELKKIKVKTPILILGYTDPRNYHFNPFKKLNFHYAVWDLETARRLNKKQKEAKIHLFVDTGMCREGVPLEQLENFIKELKKLKNLKIVGLCSHMADADNPKDDSFSQMQLLNFKEADAICKLNGIRPQWKHIAASAASLKFQENTFNLARVGLATHGISPLDKKDPLNKDFKLRPTLEFSSKIAQIKKIKKGDKVSYNGIFTAEKEMTIAIIPAGYYDGVDRRLSNKGFFKVGENFCPIIGRVCMNITVIDISKVENVKVGDKVIIYSRRTENKNSVQNSAKIAGTIPYIITTNLAASTKRKII